ncbi:hypothetical protein OCK74_21780 [Chitinophagaceae bacterium LB-8]|uniref:Uncharacterized protein n=1 Tax=Paraflavisolibacter caeni TaxID=2982496 RepID=A0A9X3BIQ1_9BACT|nr:hypothetical protein [Paraflavisolibacter caeni]MCU7551767.1 hypothetical protein [Paraflavisolibacter caeni]
MRNPLLLKQYIHSIPASSLALPAMSKNVNKGSSEQQPLMQVMLDFENGHLKLEGDWQFLIASNEKNDAACVNYNQERISLDAAIYPALPINLDDEESNGLVLALEGRIKEGAFFSYCTGLLVIDSIRTGFVGPQLNITFLLYDLQVKNSELTFKLPVYTTVDTNYNN